MKRAELRTKNLIVTSRSPDEVRAEIASSLTGGQLGRDGDWYRWLTITRFGRFA